MRTITLEAATPESGRALYSALSSFHPDFDVDDEGTCFVSVSFDSQKEMLEVFDTIQQHLGDGEEPITTSVTTTARLRLVAPDS
jgi:hypothetical protein